MPLSSPPTASELAAHWIRPNIRKLKAYPVADATGLIKLDAMENPYTWPESLRQEWAQLLQTLPINRYPDPQAHALKIKLREQFNLLNITDLEILLGNGSDELIQIIVLSLGNPGEVVLSVTPSFVMYRMIATWHDLNYIGIPLQTPDFVLDTTAMLAAIEQHQPAVIFLAYPNNPTGNLFDKASIEHIITTTSGLVVIDEAYAPFTDASFLQQVIEYENVLILRTLSKMGLAGIRLGYLIGHKAWINELNKARMPYNINALTQKTAEFALQHKQLFDTQAANIIKERERLQQALSKITGIQNYPSEANFILFQVNNAEQVFQGLKDQGILIKILHGSDPLLNNCLRVTVGTPEENTAFLTSLATII